MSARIAVDLNLFEHIVKYEPVNVAKLAELSGAEELLLSIYTLLYLYIEYRETEGTNKRVERILRPLASTKFVKEVDEETWGATPVTKAMTQKGIAAGHRMFYKVSIILAPCLGMCLEILIHLWEIRWGHGDIGWIGGRWRRGFLRVEGADNTLLVDLGGGKGHDIMAFKEKFGRREKGVGRLVLQYQPHVLKEIGEGIEKCGYDFFTEQPVKNSRIYCYHHILHDWSDYKCLEILRVLKSAMKPNYSKLIIHEMIVPESGASTYHALLDLTMMAFNGGIDRTGKEWRKLLVKAGFEVTGIWVPEVS
ncbi:hypothetical protein BTUL_0063g00560 [Botrytis tulipae]|uniref:O-methyltransferase C-terminal domain-containing protein n=1 Tax=Botrytis tulipae TaxID=87230 RepID=A0A4Z1ETR0_9HELO|nr:hypothetical protein BTUL_0063g00560 [Botrytis tulipae]